MLKLNAASEVHLRAERIPAEKSRREITWKRFDDQANCFANVLKEKGVGKGDKVVHLMMNSIDWLIAYFGIIRRGAWVVPLNFRFTGPDIQYCIDVAEPRLVLFGEEFTERITEIKESVQVRDFVFVGKKTPDFAESYLKTP